jgi:hypothetical protein
LIDWLTTEKYARKLLGEKDIESVLQRLDRLTLEESKMTIAQTLDVVYGLVNNMQVVMEGAHQWGRHLLVRVSV